MQALVLMQFENRADPVTEPGADRGWWMRPDHLLGVQMRVWLSSCSLSEGSGRYRSRFCNRGNTVSSTLELDQYELGLKPVR